MALFLLVWGEAANLRFMPELLFFLLEMMRSYVPTADIEAVHRSAGTAPTRSADAALHAHSRRAVCAP